MRGVNSNSRNTVKWVPLSAKLVRHRFFFCSFLFLTKIRRPYGTAHCLTPNYFLISTFISSKFSPDVYYFLSLPKRKAPLSFASPPFVVGFASSLRLSIHRLAISASLALSTTVLASTRTPHTLTYPPFLRPIINNFRDLSLSSCLSVSLRSGIAALIISSKQFCRNSKVRDLKELIPSATTSNNFVTTHKREIGSPSIRTPSQLHLFCTPHL